ncbi:hypothetical protein [Neorickettsia helminthoeca]|nr:hypothetical protein [Neorickettsia helminthoeca]
MVALEVLLTLVFVVVYAVSVFTFLKPKHLTSALIKGIEMTVLVTVALSLLTFLVKECALAKYCGKLKNRLNEFENVSHNPEEDEAITRLTELMLQDCASHTKSAVGKVTTALGLFTLSASLVLEILLVIDLYCPFGMQTAHGDFISRVEDACEFIFATIGLFCIGLHLCQYFYSRRRGYRSLGEKEKGAESLMLMPPASLCMSFFLATLALVTKVFKALEGTNTVMPLKVGDGYLRLGFCLGGIVCFAELITLLVDKLPICYAPEPLTELNIECALDAVHQSALAINMP